MKTLVDKAMAIMQPDLTEAWDIRTKILQTNKPFFYTLLSTSKPKFDYLLRRYRYDGIEKMQEFQQCEDLIRSDKKISNYINRHVGTSRGTKLTWSSRYVYYILEELVKNRFYPDKYDPKLFDSLYRDFEKMCYDGYIPIRDLAPLHNFDVSDRRRKVVFTEMMEHTQEIMKNGYESFFAVKPIELEKNLRIKQITHDEFRNLFDWKDSEPLTILEVGEPIFAIECSVKEPVVTSLDPPDQKYQSENSIDAVITALRLFRSPFVVYSNFFPFKDLDIFVELKHKPKHIISEKQFDAPYALSTKELGEFQTYWKKFGKVLIDSFNGKRNELGNALTYFNSAYDRTNDRDKITDLFVSASALFITKSVSDEPLTKVVSERLSELIGKTEPEKVKIRKDMKVLSEEHGKAAHGSMKTKYNYKLLEEYVRTSINEYLKQIKRDKTSTHEDIVSTITMAKSKYHYPAVAVDMIIERDDKILMVRRSGKTFQYSHAFPGGFIDEGEHVEDAVIREMEEETNVKVEPLDILGVYSATHRDPRGHIVTIVFIGKIIEGRSKAGDDAQDVKWFSWEELSKTRISSDHVIILENYLKWKKERGTYWSSKVCCG